MGLQANSDGKQCLRRKLCRTSVRAHINPAPVAASTRVIVKHVCYLWLAPFDRARGWH